jgi:hypothetical protein
MRAQHQLILDNFGDAATYPAADQWDDIDDIDYLYRKHTILARRSDAARVTAALGDIFGDVGYGDLAEGDERQIRHEDLPGDIVRVMVPSTAGAQALCLRVSLSRGRTG